MEKDSLPLQVVGKEPLEMERQVAQTVLTDPVLLNAYGGWMASLHSTAWKEIEAMAQAAMNKLVFDVRPAIEYLGIPAIVDQIGVARLVETVGIQKLIDGIGLERVITDLGAKRVAEELGVDRFFDALGPEVIFKNLSDKKRRKFKEMLG